MTSILALKTKIYQLAHSVEENEATHASEGSTISRLVALAARDSFSNYSNNQIDFFIKKYDISLINLK